MSWIVIAGVVLLAAFGPLLWLRPSAKDKRLTLMRARARALDLNVDVKPLITLNPTATERVSSAGTPRDHSRLLAVYSVILPRRLRRISGFKLLRAPGTNAAPITRGVVAVDDQWLFDPDSEFPPASGWPAVWEVLAPLAEGLGQDVAAITLEPRMLGVYWAEGPGQGVDDVADLASLLGQMAAVVAALDAQLNVQELDGDS